MICLVYESHFYIWRWGDFDKLNDIIPRLKSGTMEARLLPDSAPTPGCLGNMSMILSLLLWWISSEIFSRFRRALEYLAFVSFMADCKSVTFCFWCCSFMSSCCFTSKYGLEVRVIFEWVKIIQLKISGILFSSNELFANYYKPLANCTWKF